jgi:hypothetical protein
MKIQVTRRLAPSSSQHRYVVKGGATGRVTGDILPDLMLVCPGWAFHIIDRALADLRNARPWQTTHETITVTVEIK